MQIARGLRIEHRARAQHDLVAETVGDLLERAHRARNRHGDLGGADPAVVDGLDGLNRLLGGLAVRTTGTMPTSVMNARISWAVMFLTVTQRRFTASARHQSPALTSYLLTPRMSQTMSETEQLERILNSTQLVTSPSLSRFLRYIVEETLAGRSAEIREYTLGVYVFDRGDDFNPRLDPIVRVQARNLRGRMAKYYEGPGAEDPIRIELPKGPMCLSSTSAWWRRSRSRLARRNPAERRRGISPLRRFHHAGTAASQSGGRAEDPALLDRGRHPVRHPDRHRRDFPDVRTARPADLAHPHGQQLSEPWGILVA